MSCDRHEEGPARPGARVRECMVVSSLVLLLSASAAVAADAGKVYRVGLLDGPLAEGFESAFELIRLPAAEEDLAASLVVMTGSKASTLGDRDRAAVTRAFASSIPVVLLNATVEQINALHEALGSGQRYAAPGSLPLEAYACVLRADRGFSQLTLYSAGSRAHEAVHREARARSLMEWSLATKTQAATPPAPTTADATSGQPADLTTLVSAWTDTRSFQVSGSYSSSPANYQCTVSVWQVYQISTSSDFYYADQVCNFATGNVYRELGKKVPQPTIFSSTDWDDKPWSVTNDYCEPSSDAGDNLTACEYYHYGNAYEVGLMPLLPDGSTTPANNVVILTQENPQTTQSDSQLTHGVSWTIGGEVVAGSQGASASVSSGVTVQNTTTTTIPDVTITNQSFSSGPNGLWSYTMGPVPYIDDSCTNTMQAPKNVQITTFQSQQDMVWQAYPAYRQDSGFDGYFVLQAAFTITLSDSAMYIVGSGQGGISHPSDCNIFGCSCSIVRHDYSYSLPSSQVIFNVPVPSTDYDPAGPKG